MRGIYAGTNVLTNEVYYGQSVDIDRRLRHHLNSLKRNAHKNPKLQASWNKYGEDAFVFTPIQIIEDTTINLTPIEQKYKDNVYFLGLNAFNLKEPEDPTFLTPESRKKLSDSMKGKQNFLGHKKSKEANKKQSEKRKGIIYSPETIKRMSDSHKGKVLSEEHKKNIKKNNAKFWLGKTRSEETKRLISKNRKGKCLDNKHALRKDL
jgi:group I intron endonuclease